MLHVVDVGWCCFRGWRMLVWQRIYTIRVSRVRTRCCFLSFMALEIPLCSMNLSPIQVEPRSCERVSEIALSTTVVSTWGENESLEEAALSGAACLIAWDAVS